MTSLVIDGLTVRIPVSRGTVHAVTDARLVARAGSVHGLIGESGCGKSMLASAVIGLLPPHAVVTGGVRLNSLGGDLDLLSEWRRPRRILDRRPDPVRGARIALVPQSAATTLTPVRSLGSQLRETIRSRRSAHTEDQLLSRVGLEAAALDLFPHELSGGMAQRAAVALALVGDPEVIVADEPTSALDAERSMVILDLLARYAADGGIVLLISHDITALVESGICADISVMYASRIIETGCAEAVLGAPTQDYTRDLLAALPKNGLHPMRGMPPELTDLDEDYTYGQRASS